MLTPLTDTQPACLFLIAEIHAGCVSVRGIICFVDVSFYAYICFLPHGVSFFLRVNIIHRLNPIIVFLRFQMRSIPPTSSP